MQHIDYDSSNDRIVGFSDFGDGSVLDSVAKYATVVLIQGMFIKSSQPLSFWFTKNGCHGTDAVCIIPEVIRALRRIGFLVHAVISDQGNNFCSLSRKLGVTKKIPYFIIDDSKIWYIFDTPHLMKNTRNLLLNGKTIVMGDKIVSWAHIQELYKIDKAERLFRMALKLTDTHISPVNREKMKVKYATQVLSASVANGIQSLIQKRSISDDTADIRILNTVWLIIRYSELIMRKSWIQADG